MHFFHSFRYSSVSRYFVGVNYLPVNVLIVWVESSLICVNVVDLWRAWPSLCSCSVEGVSSVMELLSPVCLWAHILLAPTPSFLFAFHWLMRWAFMVLVEGERCFFFWTWLATYPVFTTGFSTFFQISLTDIGLDLTCMFQVNVFPSTPACFRSPTNSTCKAIVELFVDFCSL